jgi:hypothetical protein
MSCGLTLCGEAATLRFHSNNSAVSSGVWMTDNDSLSQYLTLYGNSYETFINNFDRNPHVITSSPQGQIPVVCFRIESDRGYDSSNLKISMTLQTNVGTFSADMPVYSDLDVAVGYVGLNQAIALPAGRYTMRLTASCTGYTSATTTTSFTITESPNTLAKGLGCFDAMSEGLITLSSGGATPWVSLSQGGIVSGTVGKNQSSTLTLGAKSTVFYEWSGGRDLISVPEFGGATSISDSFALYYDYGSASQKYMAGFSYACVTNAGILPAGHSVSWVYTRDGRKLSLVDHGIAVLYNPLVVKPLITVNFNSNGGSGVSGITCVPGKPYRYLNDKWPGDYPAFPENGPSQPSNAGAFAGWYNSSGMRVTGASIVPENATDHTLTARWGSGGGGSGSCDLGFYTPSTWTDSLLVTTVQGGTSSMTSIEQGTPIYLNYAFKNLAGSDDVTGFVNRFALSNGITFDHSWNNSTLHAGKYGWAGESYRPSALQDLAPGTYTLTCRLDATDKLAEINEANNTKSITFKITPPSYTLTLNPYGGTLKGNNFGSANGTTRTASVKVTYGKSSYANLGVAERGGYTFTGWWTSASGGTRVFDSNGNWIAGSYWNGDKQWIYKGDVYLYAQWREIPPSYTLTLNPYGGKLKGNNFGSANGTTRTASVTVTYGKSSYANLGVAERGGYTFTGWWTSSSGGTRVFDSNGNWIVGAYWNSDKQWIYRGNVYLYAQWKVKEPTYNVGFNPNGGILSGGNFGSKNGTAQTATVTVTYGKSSYNSGMRATRSGYMFIGWWTATTGGSQIYDASGRYKPNSRCWTSDGLWQHRSNAMLYARWLPITMGGSANWALQTDGSWRSGAVSDEQASSLQVTVSGPGTVTFHWNVSCEGRPVIRKRGRNQYGDYLCWLVDGVQQAKISGVSGGWAVVSLRIEGTGSHVIKWLYRKDSSLSEGSDCGWIRNVYWSGSAQ